MTTERLIMPKPLTMFSDHAYLSYWKEDRKDRRVEEAVYRMWLAARSGTSMRAVCTKKVKAAVARHRMLRKINPYRKVLWP